MSELLSPFASALAEFCRRHATAEHELIAASAALVAGERQRGHTGIALSEHSGRSLLGVRFPDAQAWARRLRTSGLVGNDGLLALDADLRLALARDARAERRLAANLTTRLAVPGDESGVAELKHRFAALFPTAATTCDWQAVAAAACLRSRIAVITGGPGTGKTTTVAKVLALLLQRTPDLRLALCAPTGKAAARLGESITAQLATLPDGAGLDARLPTTGTVHRLLGYDPRRDHFRHDATHPLAVDAVVIDEASMADLLLMDALIAALPLSARLIVLGDAGQLASVEAGHVLGDLSRGTGIGAGLAAWCGSLGLLAPPANGHGRLSDVVVELRENFRFRHQLGIGALADALRRGDAGAVTLALTAGHADVLLHARPKHANEALAPVLEACIACVAAPDAASCLERFSHVRLLTPLRSGTWGAQGLTALLEQDLRRRGVITGGVLYRGRPLLITANDHRLGLFNGDVGVLWDDADGMAAWFNTSTGLRRIALARLPAHDTAWVMTVHKAQGSEFDRVLLVLPPGDGPYLTRELIYTAITRAKKQVDLVADVDQLTTAANCSAARTSGLATALG